MEYRDDSTDLVPTTSASPVDPTSDAEFKFEIEKYQQYKGRLAVKLPGQRAGLLLKIVTIFGIATSAPLFFWTTHVALTADQVIAIIGLQVAAMVLTGVLGGRGHKTEH